MTSTSRLERIRRTVSDGFLDATGGSPDAVDSSGQTNLERLATSGKLNLSDVAWLVSEVDRLVREIDRLRADLRTPESTTRTY